MRNRGGECLIVCLSGYVDYLNDSLNTPKVKRIGDLVDRCRPENRSGRSKSVVRLALVGVTKKGKPYLDESHFLITAYLMNGIHQLFPVW